MKNFKQFYLWAMNAKLFMGIYFAALTLLTGLLLVCFGGKSIELLSLLEILGVSIFSAMAQVLLLPDSIDFMRGIFFDRSVIWLVLVGAVTGIAASFGGWFTGFPAWCAWVLAFAMVIGCIAMLAGLRFEQERDTIHLNKDLKTYKHDKT